MMEDESNVAQFNPKIKAYNQEIQKLLAEKPEYKEWWDDVQKQMEDGTDKNRLAIATNLMIDKIKEVLKTFREIRELSVKKQELANSILARLKELDEGKTKE